MARRISDLDASVADAQRRYREAIDAHANAEVGAREASEALSAANATLLDLRSRDHEIEDITRKIDQLNRHKQVLVDAAERLAGLEAAEAGLEKAKQAHSQAADAEAQAADLCEEKEAALAAAQANGLERQRLNATRDGLKSEVDAAQAFAKAAQDLELSQEACEKASKIARDAQARHTEAVAVAEMHERAFLAAQASVLAQRLQDGHPWLHGVTLASRLRPCLVRLAPDIISLGAQFELQAHLGQQILRRKVRAHRTDALLLLGPLAKQGERNRAEDRRLA